MSKPPKVIKILATDVTRISGKVTRYSIGVEYDSGAYHMPKGTMTEQELLKFAADAGVSTVHLTEGGQSAGTLKVTKKNPGHRRGSLTHARASAKSKLSRMPVGSIAMVGQWIDNGEYEAKVGGGMNYHERFRPVELVVKTARGTKTKKVVRGNPDRGLVVIEYTNTRGNRLSKIIGEAPTELNRAQRDMYQKGFKNLVAMSLEEWEKKRGSRLGSGGLRRRNPTILGTDGDYSNPAWDWAIMPDTGQTNTQAKATVRKHLGAGVRLGRVERAEGQIQVHYQDKKRSNPMQNLSSAKALGDHSIRIEGAELTAYARGGSKIARKYYASEGAAQRAYKGITSEKKLEAWASRNAKRKNPGATTKRIKKPSSATAVTRRMKRVAVNPVASKKFQGLGPQQMRMLRFMRKTGVKRRFHIAPDAETRRIASSLQKRGIITIDKAYTNWLVGFSAIGRAWAQKRIPRK